MRNTNLLTWNSRHIANAAIHRAIERTRRKAGYEPPIICTPEELMDDEQTSGQGRGGVWLHSRTLAAV